ncbi:MAG TPA: bifunctional pyr operon transcriptional regulator/uracil phosphoribosyltransferase PyrR [Chitinophagaceae bacterium]|nr:bifunctional pyr operon transcriptional regulator/uracil phosphoribosyltransferase PyrR [Chitinophagaceae bacterium]HNU13097.1 bifunctional pyr operon transcriptional regulator/uracil phosphoribosyltransferase PyrR [Chitinophagaceae bacterium]
MQVLLTSQQLSDTVRQLADQLIKSHTDLNDVVFVGIQQGGVVVGNDIVSNIRQISTAQKIQYGQLDITFYRDDIRKEILAPDTMNIPFAIENKTVVLIDDVLFTGRTIKAALDVLLDYGRPAKVELCVLIDRKEHRQFPIQADYVGATVETRKTDKVKLINNEVVLIDN